jgi:hypothetical protein
VDDFEGVLGKGNGIVDAVGVLGRVPDVVSFLHHPGHLEVPTGL